VSRALSYAERRKLQLRDEIIEAAFDVFAERGYHDAGAATLGDYRAQSLRIATALNDIASDLRIIRILLGQITGVDREFEQKVFAMFDLAVAFEAGYLDNGLQRGYLRADIDTAATARAVVGMIFGTAILGLNPTIDADERTETSHAAVQLMFDGIAK